KLGRVGSSGSATTTAVRWSSMLPAMVDTTTWFGSALSPRRKSTYDCTVGMYGEPARGTQPVLVPKARGLVSPAHCTPNSKQRNDVRGPSGDAIVPLGSPNIAPPSIAEQ